MQGGTTTVAAGSVLTVVGSGQEQLFNHTLLISGTINSIGRYVQQATCDAAFEDLLAGQIQDAKHDKFGDDGAVSR